MNFWAISNNHTQYNENKRYSFDWYIYILNNLIVCMCCLLVPNFLICVLLYRQSYVNRSKFLNLVYIASRRKMSLLVWVEHKIGIRKRKEYKTRRNTKTRHRKCLWGQATVSNGHFYDGDENPFTIDWLSLGASRSGKLVRARFPERRPSHRAARQVHPKTGGRHAGWRRLVVADDDAVIPFSLYHVTIPALCVSVVELFVPFDSKLGTILKCTASRLLSESSLNPIKFWNTRLHRTPIACT